MAEPSSVLHKTVRVIDAFSDWSGKLFAWLGEDRERVTVLEAARRLRSLV